MAKEHTVGRDAIVPGEIKDGAMSAADIQPELVGVATEEQPGSVPTLEELKVALMDERKNYLDLQEKLLGGAIGATEPVRISVALERIGIA